ncbi:phosphotransferase (plasmid) [Agrobacterium sp. rho-8.1]|nr:aminoglycoside phosphotransferase family protein [Agrobacterium sp. rho-8.1]
MTPLLSPEFTSGIEKVLANQYGFSDAKLSRLNFGEGGYNFKAVGNGYTVFVKQYVQRSNLGAENEAIEATELARRSGVPTPQIIENKFGHRIDKSTNHSLSVWSWIDGEVKKRGLEQVHYREIGEVLGRIHRTFANIAQAKSSPQKTIRWFDISVTNLRTEISSLEKRVSEKIRNGFAEDFDRNALLQLATRRTQLDELLPLLQSLPPLTSQVLHGDYSLVNILFSSGRLAAVVDFRPPEAFLIAYELGRIAFYPNTVEGTNDWLDYARLVVEGYCTTNPEVNPNDIRASARVALIQLLKSLYGIKEHYNGGGLLQEELDEFWRLRHIAATKLLRDIDRADRVMSEISKQL